MLFPTAVMSRVAAAAARVMGLGGRAAAIVGVAPGAGAAAVLSRRSAAIAAAAGGGGARRALHASGAVHGVVLISVPKMGDSITEGTVLSIAVPVGGAVAQDGVVMTLETDKVCARACARRGRARPGGVARVCGNGRHAAVLCPGDGAVRVCVWGGGRVGVGGHPGTRGGRRGGVLREGESCCVPQ